MNVCVKILTDDKFTSILLFGSFIILHQDFNLFTNCSTITIRYESQQNILECELSQEGNVKISVLTDMWRKYTRFHMQCCKSRLAPANLIYSHV